MRKYNYEKIAAGYISEGYTELDLMAASDNAIECLVSEHGQTYKTVWDFYQTDEGYDLFCKYVIARIEG